MIDHLRYEDGSNVRDTIDNCATHLNFERTKADCLGVSTRTPMHFPVRLAQIH